MPQFSKPHLRDQRLEARITRDQKRLIERAAQLRGSTVTDFVVSEIQEAAAATILEFEVLQLRAEARDQFMQALLNPPAPNRAAKAAMARYKKRVKQ